MSHLVNIPGLPCPRYVQERPSAAEVAVLFDEAGLNGPLSDLPRLDRMIGEAQHVLTARVGDELAGLIRVLTDFSFNAFVADLAVRPSHQYQGIGSELVRRATLDWPGVKFVVHPGHDSAAFWLRRGFVPASTCLVRPRAR